MKAFGVAIALWTLAALWVVLFDLGDASMLLPCMRLVGRSSACEAAQATVNDAVWLWHTLPLLIAVGAGYVAIITLRLLWVRRHARDEQGVSGG